MKKKLKERNETRKKNSNLTNLFFLFTIVKTIECFKFIFKFFFKFDDNHVYLFLIIFLCYYFCLKFQKRLFSIVFSFFQKY
jgi:hypothetical protein